MRWGVVGCGRLWVVVGGCGVGGCGRVWVWWGVGGCGRVWEVVGVGDLCLHEGVGKGAGVED